MGNDHRGAFEKAVAVEGRVPGEQSLEVLGQLGLLAADARQPRPALAIVQVERLVEERAERQPALATE